MKVFRRMSLVYIQNIAPLLQHVGVLETEGNLGTHSP
jgi:hypothetical protein